MPVITEQTQDESLQEQINALKQENERLKKCKKYGLVWEDHTEELDKKDVIPLLAKDDVLSLPEVPDKKQNYLIEGDNYHALKALQHTHAGNIDVIYIDPPYNTGNEFVYNDKIVDSEDAFRHSKWLSFMNKRLKLARELMSDDGVIFISIDDNEQAQLKLLCDEIFGARNFVGQYMWERSASPANLSRKVKKRLEYILCYEKTKNSKRYKGRLKKSKSTDSMVNGTSVEKTLVFPPNSVRLSIKDGVLKAGTYGTEKYPNVLLDNLIIKDGRNENEIAFTSKFRWSQPKLLDEIKNQNDIRLSKQLVFSHKKKAYAPDVPTNIINGYVDVQTAEDAGKILFSILGSNEFDYPKPVSLIEYLIDFTDDKDATILDFFAGSGTTGHAVMELNQEDGGNRNFILCTNNEVSDERVRTYLFEQGDIPKNNKTEFNKYKKDFPDVYQAFLDSPEYESLGIARAVTRERMKRVIQGYTTPKGKDVPALPNNLTYLQTKEFDKHESLGMNRKELSKLAFNSHLIKYPESIYQSVKIDLFTDWDSVQIDKSKKTVVFVDVRDRESFINIADSVTEKFGKDVLIETLDSYFN